MTPAVRPLIVFAFSVAAPGEITLTVTRADTGAQLGRFTRAVTGRTPSWLAGMFKADCLPWTYGDWRVEADWNVTITMGGVWGAFRQAIRAVPVEWIRDGSGGGRAA